MKTSIRFSFQSCQKRAFTLVELLVTITIIVALAALSFMGVSRLRTSADRTRSVGNLAQLQIASSIYAVDHNGRFVSIQSRGGDGVLSSHWWNNTDFLVNYRGDTGLGSNGRPDTSVSVSMLDPVAVRSKKNLTSDIRANYGGVIRPGTGFSVSPSDSSYTMGELVAPERTAAFATATDWQIVYGSRKAWKGIEGKTGNGAMAYRHGNKALVAFYDGHVDAVTMDDIAKIDSNGGVKNLFWDGTAR